MTRQILVIHGGDAFETYEEYLDVLHAIDLDLTRATRKGWKQSLSEVLGNAYEVIQPRMPNPNNAQYLEWKIWFEKHIPFLHDDVILIGHSLGGIFLAKYLSEEVFPKKILATFLIAAPYSSEATHSLATFNLTTHLKKLEEQGGEIVLFQSHDDEIVPIENVHLYARELPNSDLIFFEDRGHFNQEEFPELVEVIKMMQEKTNH